jgi:peroxiredoxin
MALTPSTMAPLGTQAPDFRLPDTDGRIVSLADFADEPALLVAFVCNHCPYVKHVREAFADSPEMMKQEKAAAGYTFPYLFDATQEVARAYRAACTPDFFVFGRDRRLAYRGQMDASRPGNGGPPDGADLRAALDAVLAGKSPSPEQTPSMGCNIKWRPGNEPAY